MVLDPNPDRPTLSVRAPAKLNLALAVGPPRPEDGYHPICSWMATIDLADDLLLTRLEDDRLSRYAILWHDDAPVRSDINWSITRDLAVRAHLLLEQTVGRPLPVQLKLEKRIPVGGGLGGGSSNAAQMLIAVRRLFDLDLDDQRLIALSHQLGSDVPFFVSAALRAHESNSAIIASLGEDIAKAPAVAATGLLILPDFGCPTPRVYRAFDADPIATDHDGFAARTQRVRALAEVPEQWPRQLFNDLARPAQDVAPALRSILSAASDVADVPAHLTGSGSACFVILEDDNPATRQAIQTDLEAELPGCTIVAFRTLMPSA